MTSPENPKIWTKKLVQEHAQAVAAVELYTLPLYISALTSVKNPKDTACAVVLSVAVEEMLHLQVAANLCLALDTLPNLKPPQYGTDVPYLKPYDPETGERGFLNAVIGPLDDETLNTMLDIENPEEVPIRQTLDHSSPQYPYSSIGEMYDALLVGIQQVGVDRFSWTTRHQQAQWGKQQFPQIITHYTEAHQAVQAVTSQGEGYILGEVLQAPPWTEKDFPIPEEYRLLNDPKDPAPYNGYAHFGRFLKLKLSPLPEIYTGIERPQDPIHKPLQENFFQLILMLETLWTNGGANLGGNAVLWAGIQGIMHRLLGNARACWQAGVIPNWFDPESLLDWGKGK
jgi:hypothetical protein